MKSLGDAEHPSKQIPALKGKGASKAWRASTKAYILVTSWQNTACL